ncbi:uncharacterized protein LOC129581802 [Paramacrobiotus metropolitanus]|uniref:uncharacterized protein LOC129581802 n=1 Tax=Paramacrobiotus metropolitanus TaxID=2943436 RepID=UPI002445BB2F|nr:uncharacterized protein LOC129581802 [Paramacrobiotus metropolitanus]XP_055329027.1 uncharacterized protein LOC129581802 [Paramacrobiotus metropolitanus]XP_055329028.1 uncharacterized protein LOC129581802 [Paramacrobiotus metropolitanus]XP_055329029.1 uncharacterized protein LOC129581802 [Paramacrobiotus metropolitanus]
MTSLKEQHKSLADAMNDFKRSLKGSLELSRDHDDWDKLGFVIEETAEALKQADLEIRKRYPPYRERKNPFQNFTGLPTASTTGSVSSHVSTSSGNVVAPVPFAPVNGFGRGDAEQPGNNRNNQRYLNKPDLLSEAERTRIDRAKFNKSPTKINHKTKNDWLDSEGPKEENPFGIFVPGLSPNTKENDMRAAFGSYGRITKVIIHRDSRTNESNLGKVWFESKEPPKRLIRTTVTVNERLVTIAPLYQKPRVDREKSEQGSATTVTSGQQSSRTVETLRETTISRKVPSDSGSLPDAAGKCMMCPKKVDCVLSCGHRVVCGSCADKLAVCPQHDCGRKVEKVLASRMDSRGVRV